MQPHNQKIQRKYLTQNKPKAPELKAQIKLHKPGNPIRPIVNNTGAPNYKLAKFLSTSLKAYIHLKHITIHDKRRLISFDIKDLYVNIPIDETINITKPLLLAQNDKTITQQMITLLEITLQQNYFSFENNIYQPTKGISMGSPLSGDIVEIFLQHIEQTNIKHIMENKNITLYTRYVDDILIIYDSTHCSVTDINIYMNAIHPNFKFTPTQEVNNHKLPRPHNNQT